MERTRRDSGKDFNGASRFRSDVTLHRLVFRLTVAAIVFLVGVHVYRLPGILSQIGVLVPESTVPAATNSISEQQHRTLTPLRQQDYEFYTIRINTWKRLDQLQTSIEHHKSCPGAAQIQVVWCMDQGEPPASLTEHEKVVVERHEVNSLNERFRILQEPTNTRDFIN